MSKVNLKKVYLYGSVIALFFIFLLQFFNVYAIIVGIPLLLFILFLGKKDIPKFPLILFGTMLLLRILCIIKFDTPAQSDFLTILEAAKELINDHNVMNTSSYFQLHGYQTGPVLYTAFLLKIWNSVFFLKLMNCIFSSLNCVMIYYICKKITSKSSARIASLLYGILPFSFLYNTVLTNQIPGSTFFYLGILLLMYCDKRRIKTYIFSALLFGIGNFLRPEGIIFVCAILGIYLLNVIYKKEGRKDKKYALCMIIFIIVYFMFGFLTNKAVVLSGINQFGLKDSQPSWKFIIGFNCSGYSDNDIPFLGNGEATRTEIRNRIKSLSLQESLELSSCKITNQWDGGTLWWTFAGLENKNYTILNFQFTKQNLYDILSSFNKMIYFISLALATLGILTYTKKDKIDDNILYFINILAINFCVYLLIEVQSRYIYLLQISIFVLASLGIEYLKNIYVSKSDNTIKRKRLDKKTQ